MEEVMIPRVAFYCHECEELILWDGSDDDLSIMLEDMRVSECIPCPSCGDLQDIDEETRRMLV